MGFIPTMRYSPKFCYDKILNGRDNSDQIWWWHVVWKFKRPLKTKIFMWFLLTNKALTWNVLRRKGQEGHGV